MDAFYTALSAAQNKAQFTSDVQDAAQGIDVDALKVAVQVVLAGDATASVSGDQATALKAGFEFATKVVKMLEKEPGTTEMLTLYKYFKRSNNEEPKKPGMFALEAKAKYNAWESVKDISDQKAQAEYIKEVNRLMETIGLRSE